MNKDEASGRAVLDYEWFDRLVAPLQKLIIVDHSGHRPLFAAPTLFASVMAQVVDETSQMLQITGVVAHAGTIRFSPCCTVRPRPWMATWAWRRRAAAIPMNPMVDDDSKGEAHEDNTEQ